VSTLWRLRINSAEIVLRWPSATIAVSGPFACAISQFLVHVRSNFASWEPAALSCSTALTTLPASGFFRQYQPLPKSRLRRWNHLENIDLPLCRFRIPTLGASTIVSASCQLASTQTQSQESSECLPQPATRAIKVLANRVLISRGTFTNTAKRSDLSFPCGMETVNTPFSTLGCENHPLAVDRSGS
jgi:hypothetical protein